MNSFIPVSTYISDEKFLEAIDYMGLQLIHVSNVARVHVYTENTSNDVINYLGLKLC